MMPSRNIAGSGGFMRRARGLVHSLGAMDGTRSNPEGLDAGAPNSVSRWTPVTASEAERVLRSVVEGVCDLGDEQRSESQAHHTPQTRTIGRVIVTAVLVVVGYFVVSWLSPVPSGDMGASLDSIGTSDGAAFASDGELTGARQGPAMNRSIAATVMAMGVAGTAFAQGAAVQWKVSEGGNGHWYQTVTPSNSLTWKQAENFCGTIGAHLATVPSAEEDTFVHHVVGETEVYLGAFQPSSSCEPSCDWKWVTDEPWNYTNWSPGEPNNSRGNAEQDCLRTYPDGSWDDARNEYPYPFAMAVEWDADCNHDGIVDYGQCHDGSLADYNVNNIPDCCENGEACVVANHPVQWRLEDGGNGHWYQRATPTTNLTWLQARDFCVAIGAQLATVPSVAEDTFVHLVVGQTEVYLGAFQAPSSCEPNCDWQWVTGENWNYTNWSTNEPNNGLGNADQDGLRTYPDGKWDDAQNGYPYQFAIAVEWSADCNQDGIVDYGQILNGQVADTNSNGIPDVCEVPTCASADLTHNGIVDGSDLGVMLGFWGQRNPVFPQADINGDGVVNGADLGIMLSFWGNCQ